MISTPATEQLQLGVSVFFVGSFSYPFDGSKHLFDVDHILYGTMDGHANMATSQLSMLVTMNGVGSLQIKPGQQNSGLPLGISLPDWFGYLFLGFQGTYGTVDIQDYAVNLNPDVDANFRIQKTFSPIDLFDANLKLTPTNSLVFHRYTTTDTSTEKFDLNVILPVGCLTLSTRPGLAEMVQDGIHLDSANGPQMVSFVDPGGEVAPWILDLFAYATSPIGGMNFDYNLSPGGC